MPLAVACGAEGQATGAVVLPGRGSARVKLFGIERAQHGVLLLVLGRGSGQWEALTCRTESFRAFVRDALFH